MSKKEVNEKFGMKRNYNLSEERKLFWECVSVAKDGSGENCDKIKVGGQQWEYGKLDNWKDSEDLYNMGFTVNLCGYDSPRKNILRKRT